MNFAKQREAAVVELQKTNDRIKEWRGPYLHIEVEACPNMTQAEKTELLVKISGWVNEAIEILSDNQAQARINKVRNQVRS